MKNLHQHPMNWCRTHHHKVVFPFRQPAAYPNRLHDIRMNSPRELVRSSQEFSDLDSLAVAHIFAEQSAMVVEFCDNLDRLAYQALYAILLTNHQASFLLIAFQILYPRNKDHHELSFVVWFAICKNFDINEIFKYPKKKMKNWNLLKLT